MAGAVHASTYAFTLNQDGCSGNCGSSPYGTVFITDEGSGAGASSPLPGPISFDVNGVTTSDFIANSNGNYFASDILGSNGDTGNVAADSYTELATLEPGTLSLLFLGMALVFAGVRRKRAAELKRFPLNDASHRIGLCRAQQAVAVVASGAGSGRASVSRNHPTSGGSGWSKKI